MKSIFLFITIALLSSVAIAQQPYNGSFEQWSTRLQPDGWGTWAAVYYVYNNALGDSMMKLAARDSSTHADYPHDTISVRLTVDTVSLPSLGPQTYAGFLSYGGAYYIRPPDTARGLHFGYYPYKKMPDSLIFDYKYIPAPGFTDTALAIMTMQRFDSAIQTEISYLSTSWRIDTASVWTHVAIPLRALYNNTVTLPPDTIQLIFLSSVAYPLHRGTTLWLDSEHFDASINILPTAINDISHLRGITAYPNPANSAVNILIQQEDAGSSIYIYDASGRSVYSGTLDKLHTTINTQELNDGIYTIRIHSVDHLTIYSGNISIVR